MENWLIGSEIIFNKINPKNNCSDELTISNNFYQWKQECTTDCRLEKCQLLIFKSCDNKLCHASTLVKFLRSLLLIWNIMDLSCRWGPTSYVVTVFLSANMLSTIWFHLTGSTNCCTSNLRKNDFKFESCCPIK